MSNVGNSHSVTVKVWDLPTRLFHWSLATLVFSQLFTGFKQLLIWHIPIGCTIVGLIIFRILWGFWGSQTSRFSSFIKGISSVFKYLIKIIKNQPTYHLGHNPAGGWVILFILSILSIQLITGVFSGLIGYLIPQEFSELAWNTHKITALILIATIITHISANLFYLIVRKDNLIIPMIIGIKKTSKPKKFKFASNAKALIFAIIAFILPFYIYYYM
jgi:cytochrome b